MAKAKKDKQVKQSFKKELKKKIAFQLTNTLGDLKDLLGEKKFSTRIRKASKILGSGIKQQTAPADTPKRKKKTTAKPKVEKLVAVAEEPSA